MTNMPTLEQFMTQPEPDEEDAPDGMYTWGPSMRPPEPDPLVSIAHTLDRMLAIAEHHELEEQTSDRLREAHDDLDAKHAVLWDLVLEIEAIIKPSTSKLAIQVREAIGRWRGVDPEPAEAATEAAAEVAAPVGPVAVSEIPNPAPVSPPAKDADVDVWRAYAEALGENLDELSQMNRSQIRTRLGLPQA